MNHSPQPACHCRRAKMVLTRAILGGAMCFACGNPLIADEKLPRSPRTVLDTIATPMPPATLTSSVRLRLPRPEGDAASHAVVSPSRWADLSRDHARNGSTNPRYAVSPTSADSDRQRDVVPSITPSVHVGPDRSAFIPEPFNAVRRDSGRLTQKPLRPVRLPPTGYFDESMLGETRIATGPDRPRP